MGWQEDRDKSEKDIREAELRVMKFKTTMKEIQAEMDKLHLLENALIENISFLKASNATVMATEYKKVKEDLIRTRGRLSLIRIDMGVVLKGKAECEVYLQKARDLMAASIIGKDNVLSFKKRKNDGS